MEFKETVTVRISVPSLQTVLYRSIRNSLDEDVFSDEIKVSDLTEEQLEAMLQEMNEVYRRHWERINQP